MSEAKTVAAIDYWVDRLDPHALRRSQRQARSRGVQIDTDDGSGLASLWGTLFTHDAKVLDERLDAMAREVCEADPRTLEQRRADALGAVAGGADRLGCACGGKDCPYAEHTSAAGAAGPVVVYVVTGEDTISDDTAAAAAQDAALDGCEPVRASGKALREMTVAEAFADPVPGGFTQTRPGVMIGGPVLAGPVIRRVALQAVIRRIAHPGAAPPELPGISRPGDWPSSSAVVI